MDRRAKNVEIFTEFLPCLGLGNAIAKLFHLLTMLYRSIHTGGYGV